MRLHIYIFFLLSLSFSQNNHHHNNLINRVFLLRQLWIVNYYVKSSSNNLSNENIKTGVSKIVHFAISIYILSCRQQKHQCLCLHYWDYLMNFWRNNWRSIIDVVERLSSCINYYEICQRKVLGIFSWMVSVKLNGSLKNTCQIEKVIK